MERSSTTPMKILSIGLIAASMLATPTMARESCRAKRPSQKTLMRAPRSSAVTPAAISTLWSRAPAQLLQRLDTSTAAFAISATTR
jgi:hypothetical protein